MFTGRMPRTGIAFTHRPKISIFDSYGQFVAPIHVKFSTAEGHEGPLGCAKFRANRFTRVGTRPPNVENFHFLAESSSRGEPCDRFLQFLEAFIRPTIPRKSVSNLTRFSSPVTELLLRNRGLSFSPKFFVHPVGKTMRWLDRKIIPTFLMVSTLDVLYHRAKFGEDRTTRAGCRCEMWCLFFFFSHAPMPAGYAFEGCVVRTSIM